MVRNYSSIHQWESESEEQDDGELNGQNFGLFFLKVIESLCFIVSFKRENVAINNDAQWSV